MLLYSPPVAVSYPGFAFIALGLAGMLWLFRASAIYGVQFDIHTFLYAAMTVMIGFQAISFAVFSKVFAISEGLLSEDARLTGSFGISPWRRVAGGCGL